jgi:predicted kinase
MLYLLRGLPGSGKSTYAAKLQKMPNVLHYEADMYFMKDGVYTFDFTKLADAHTWCLKQTVSGLKNGMSVVVSNTFTTRWEMQNYLTWAEQLNVTVSVVKCIGEFGSVHNIPAETLKRMADRWEDYDGETVYNPNKEV